MKKSEKRVLGVNAYKDVSGNKVPAQAVINDIIVVNDLVVTPAGTWPLAGTRWDYSETTLYSEGSRWPTWAIVCFILTFWTIFGLFFLIPRKRWSTQSADVTVTVSTPEGYYSATRMNGLSPKAAYDIQQRVAWINNLSVNLHNAR